MRRHHNRKLQVNQKAFSQSFWKYPNVLIKGAVLRSAVLRAGLRRKEGFFSRSFSRP
jgi:hypothetical protein